MLVVVEVLVWDQLDHKVTKVTLVLLDLKVVMDYKVQQVHKETNSQQVPKVVMDCKVPLVYKEVRVRLELKVVMDCKVTQDQQDHRAYKELQELREQQEKLGQLVLHRWIFSPKSCSNLSYLQQLP